MTDEEIIQFCNEMLEFFGELPSPEHEPIRFAHCIKLYTYYKERKDGGI